jgi:hypothetical protein
MNWSASRVMRYRRPEKGASKARSGDPEPAPLATRIRVGIWDMDVSAGALPRLLDVVDESQSKFTFTCIQAPYQTGLTLPGARTANDWFDRTGSKMPLAFSMVNVAARPIFAAAKPVLKEMPVEWLVVVIKNMISDTTDKHECWYNLFSTSSKNVILISTFELRHYAAKAGRSFEAAVLGVALSGLLAAMVPEIEYQNESTGSIFDFAQNRADIVKSIRKPTIDSENRARIPADLLPDVEKILAALEEYQGGPALKNPRKVKPKKFASSMERSAIAQPNRKVPSRPNAATSFSKTLAALSNSLEKRKQAALKQARPGIVHASKSKRKLG